MHEANAEELDAGDKREYKVKAIWDNAVYAKESELGHLLELYYLVFGKKYPEEENTWEPASAVQHLRKLINSFHKDHLNKPTTTSPVIDAASPMARLTVKSTKPLKRKRGQPTGCAKKRTKAR